ncbi:MAG: hypothetical protein ACE5G8_08240, partial [Anaerolineae bacterium]
MQKITNPYLPGQIPESKDGFFGREELVTWLEQQIIARRRVMVLHGPSLIGKTTFLRLAPQLLTLEAVIVTLSVAELSDPAPETVLTALMQTLARQAAPPADSPPPTDAVAAFDNLLAQTRQRRPAAEIALLLDDFDHFLTRFPVETDLFLGVCQTLLARHSYLHLLLALQSTSLPHLNHPLLDTAAVRQITVLKRNDALRMITRPVEGVLRFDYGVPKRIAELTSNHPHYLTLFNHTLFSRYAREGWVNLRHLDETLNDVLNTDIPSFTAIWQESTWVERAVLSAMASVKGTHGIFTRQEVLAALLRHDHKAEGKVILTALESLAYRGILVKMGALGYRFCVDLFRYWLQQQFNLPAVLNDVIWQEPAARPQPPSPEAVQPAPGPRTPAWPVWMWGLLGLALVGLLALGFTVLAARTRARVTPTPVIAPEQAVAGFKTALAPTPSPTVTSAPTATATP